MPRWVYINNRHTSIKCVGWLISLKLIWIIVDNSLFIFKKHGSQECFTLLACWIVIASSLPQKIRILSGLFLFSFSILLLSYSMGYCILVALGVGRLCTVVGRYGTTVISVSVVLLLFSFSWKTVHQNQVWLSREALFRWAKKKRGKEGSIIDGTKDSEMLRPVSPSQLFFPISGLVSGHFLTMPKFITTMLTFWKTAASSKRPFSTTAPLSGLTLSQSTMSWTVKRHKSKFNLKTNH